jgi:hypothetical protein
MDQDKAPTQASAEDEERAKVRKAQEVMEHPRRASGRSASSPYAGACRSTYHKFGMHRDALAELSFNLEHDLASDSIANNPVMLHHALGLIDTEQHYATQRSSLLRRLLHDTHHRSSPPIAP